MTVDEFRQVYDTNPVEEVRRARRNGDPEHQLQCRCVRWFRLEHPGHFITAIPNGGRRDRVTGAKLKAEGVVAGVPDLLVPESNGKHNCLWIEMKNGTKGHLSESQKEMHDILRSKGNCVRIARTFDEFVEIIEEYYGE